MVLKVVFPFLLKVILCAVIILSVAVSCKSNNSDLDRVETTDFQTTMIGTQEWMTENLNVDTFRNGDLIPEAKTNEEWELAGAEGKPCWCYYDNDPANGKTYGKLYNWYAVSDKRGLTPEGWHVPDLDDWSVLADFLGGPETAGEKMKSSNGWNEDGNGNDESGFSGFPGGYRADFGSFYGIGTSGAWWSSTRQDEIPDYAFRLSLSSENEMADWIYDTYGTGYSVRCIKD